MMAGMQREISHHHHHHRLCHHLHPPPHPPCHQYRDSCYFYIWNGAVKGSW